MSHPAVIKASALIHAGDIVAAESALTELVDTEGDHALVTVLDELAPKDLLAIIREYDSSKPSVVNLLVTPAQFADAVIMERLYAERNRDRLRSMINSVIFRDEVEPDDFIAALLEKDLGMDVLAGYLDERFDEVSTFKTCGNFAAAEDERAPKDEADDSDDAAREGQFSVPKGGVSLDEISDRDWMELTWRLAHHFPDEFVHVFEMLSARARAAEEVPLKAEDGDAEGTFAFATKGGGVGGGVGGAGAEEESAL